MNEFDIRALFSHVQGAKVDEVVKALGTGPNRQSSFVITKIALKTEGATSVGPVELRTGPGPSSPVMAENVTLTLVNGDWLLKNGDNPQGLFSQIAKMGRNPELLAGAKKNAIKTSMLSNMKQIGTCAIMYANDHDDKIKFTQATLKKELLVYSRTKEIFLDEVKQPLDVRVNPALIGKAMSTFDRPAQLVFLTVGPKGALRFWEELTPVVFLDGHAKLIKRADVAKLVWK